MCLWCHVRHINPVKIHPERITKVDKKLVEDLDYAGVEFPVQEKDLNKTETKSTVCIYVFCYENGLIFPIYVSEEIFENLWIFCLHLMRINRIMCTSKILTDLCFTKQKIKTKKHFCRSSLQCFRSENVLTKHKKDCLSISGAQSVKLEKGTIKFKNYFKQIPVSFKIYADFVCNLEVVEIYEGFTQKISNSHSL